MKPFSVMVRSKIPSTAQKTVPKTVLMRLPAWDRDRKSPPFECIEGVEVERIFLFSSHGCGNTQLFFCALLYLRMLWHCLRTSFEAVHCHDLDTLPLAFLLGKLKRKPIAYDAHQSFPDMIEGSVNTLIRRALVNLENFLIGRTDLLITLGEKLRQFFAYRGARHSVVVGNWKRIEEFSRTEQENLTTPSRLRIAPETLVVVCITQLLKDRKVEELFDAVAACPDFYVIVAGRGVLEGMVRDAGFDPENPNARFSTPNKLYEALGVGRPLITRDFGEIADVVRAADRGIVLPRYDATEIRAALIALQNPDLRRRFAESARRFGSSFIIWTKGEEILFTEYSAMLGWPAVTGESAAARTMSAHAGAR
jgi:glycosyltransferase involved in cell wall biosynthesis